MPQSLQSITNEALKQFSTKTNKRQIQYSKVMRQWVAYLINNTFLLYQQEINRKIIGARQQALDINIESLLNEISKDGKDH